MIESIENTAQIAVLVICTGLALNYAVKNEEKRSWMCVFFFFGSRLLGDVYWQVFLFYHGETPENSLISDLSWYASLLFLYLLLNPRYGKKGAPTPGIKSGRPIDVGGSEPLPETGHIRMLIPWIGPLFTASMALYYIQWGEILSNIIYAALMGLLLFEAIRGLFGVRGQKGREPVCLMVLAFCLLEYGSWTASCFWDYTALQYTYYGFDILMTICFPFFIPAIRHTERVAGR